MLAVRATRWFAQGELSGIPSTLNNIPRIGRVLIARGRDAADVAISSTFGLNTLNSFKVRTDEVSEG
jgi:hypothetical protein